MNRSSLILKFVRQLGAILERDDPISIERSSSSLETRRLFERRRSFRGGNHEHSRDNITLRITLIDIGRSVRDITLSHSPYFSRLAYSTVRYRRRLPLGSGSRFSLSSSSRPDSQKWAQVLSVLGTVPTHMIVPTI